MRFRLLLRLGLSWHSVGCRCGIAGVLQGLLNIRSALYRIRFILQDRSSCGVALLGRIPKIIGLLVAACG